MSENYISICVTSNDLNKRLDKFLSEKIDHLSRRRIQSIIVNENVRFNGSTIISASSKIKSTGKITVKVPESSESTIESQEIKINVIYEDSNIIVLNKEAGMVVHPGAGNNSNTLVNALLHHCKGSLSGIGGILRPGIVHRIDKMTSGLIVVAKDDNTHVSLSNQFKDQVVNKEYILFCWGNFTKYKGNIKNYIIRSPKNRKKMSVSKIDKGKFSFTEYEVIEKFRIDEKNYISLVRCWLKTGRTHQIRVHMSHIGHNLIGDKLYGSKKNEKIKDEELKKLIFTQFIDQERHALHAKKLSFKHPVKNQEMNFEAELPEDFEILLKHLSQ